MSNEIKCKTCGYENPHSSKFCNNCGTKLPLSTHIICPNCETPNTRDRVFCDTCGTRLIAETIQPEEEPSEESPPPVNEPFSLPVRRPGDTGELDPNAVPDWLRTGDIGSIQEPSDVPSTPDDSASQAGSKDTHDLPEWLVHDSDPEPIINAPTTISTEFYQDLLNKAEDLPQPDDLFADEDEANLPDWLADADNADAAPTADDAEASSGLTDWLSELGEAEGEDETAVSDQESTDGASEGLTDWLHELDDLENPAEAHAEENAAALDELLDDLPDAQPNEEADSSDWLSELGPVQTDIFEPQTDDQHPGTTELPGWMDELGPLQTNLLDPDQIAQLTGPLSGMSDDDIVDDEEAGADVSFTDLFETASETTDPLPDWLDAAAEDGESFLTDLPDDSAEEQDEPHVVSEAESDWFTADQIVAETDLDWLAETDNLETAVTFEDEPLTDFDFSDDLPDEATETADSLDEFSFDDEAEAAVADAAGDDLDWLSDMAAIQTGELVVEPVSEETAVPSEEVEDVEDAQPEEPEPAPQVEEDSWQSDAILAESTVGEDLPDWLDQLDEQGQAAEPAKSDSASEELPEWIASMRPSEGFIGSELPGVLSEMDLRDTLEGIPEELAGAELPDWLQDTPLDDSPLVPFEASDKDDAQEIPDWLQPEAPEEETAVPTPTALDDVPESGSSRNEWNTLLEELPPLTPLAESLPKAEIPEWVQELKPPELTGQPPRELEGPEETSGPLKGMNGIVPIEPAVARPRVAEPLTPYVTTPEQLQQVALLRQITQEVPETITTLDVRTAYSTAVWLRIGVGILLIAALLFGLRGPSLVAPDLPASPNVQAVETAIANAAGQPVLLAIEYTPAMAAELSPQAELLLNQLAANGSSVLITSQYAAGTAVANNLIGDAEAQMVGYLPGEGIGLRQLGNCLAGRNDCDQLNGRLLDDDIKANLSQTGLIIVLTGDRDNLVNWVEQVGSVATNVPVIAGVTQALTPLANTYASTEQLAGLLGGIPDAVAYEQLIDQPESGLASQLNAQIFGQLLAAAMLLIGLLVYGATGLMDRRRGK